MGRPSWEDEGNMWEDEEESTDMGDDLTVSMQPQTTVRAATRGGGQTRRIRVKPMPSGMRQKWPNVVSCLLTLASGKQVMFVKGA